MRRRRPRRHIVGSFLAGAKMLVPILVAIGLAFAVLVVGGWLLTQLTRQNREIGRRLTKLDGIDDKPARAARPLHAGLPARSVLNDFELPNLAGGTTTLSQWHGRRVALIFVRPDCQYSRRLIPLLLGRGAPTDAAEPMPLIVSSGDPATNHAFFGETPQQMPILLQADSEVAQVLRVAVTPAAYLVDQDRVTEGPLIFGLRAIANALGIAPPADGDQVEASETSSNTTPLPMTWPEALKPLALGTVLPTRVLMGMNGEQIALGPGLTRPMQLVLVDPDCPRCRDIAPMIAAWWDGQPVDRDLVLVSKGTDATTRNFAGEFHLSCPIALQRNRDAAHALRTLETPAALILDPGGVVASTIAVGTEAVLAQLGPAASLPRPPAVSSDPLVSVILTTRDRPGFLPFALSCYDWQTYRHRELIVVDDGDRYPVDPRVVEAVGGRLVRAAPGTPIGAKLNLGLDEARGVLCQKMDDDDWYAPAYIETMVEGIEKSWSVACRPTVAFVTPFLFFDVARWEIRRSLDRNVPGATLFFRRSDWIEHRFRSLPGDEDLWFYLDQLRAGAVPLVIDRPELFLAVRHRGVRQERGHTWVTQWDNRPLEDHLLERPLHPRTPEQVLPIWALAFYQSLHTQLVTADAAPDESATQ